MYYRINSTKVSHLEYWLGTRNPLVVLGWLTKWLRVPLPSSSDDPNVESLIPFETPAELVPPDVLGRFQPLLAELGNLGFHTPVYHVIFDRFHQTKIYWASLPHASGQAWARIHHRIWTQAQPTRVYLFPIFFSALQDGRFLVSSAAGKQDMLAAPACRFVHCPKATATDLWARHQRELETEQLRTSVRPVRSAEELRQAIEAHHIVTRDFHVQRGVFVPMKPEEERQNTATPPIVGEEHAEVLLQLEALQKQKPSWGNALGILVISAIAFFASSSSQGSWKFALGLIPILLFHEAGHYLAMRLFNYSNLRMFFIPFFGAAVTGSNYNIPGWKKAIVSLMGPVPGIALGIGVGILGLFLHQPLLVKGAFFMLFLNAFNLLPVLPLDGGWVLHTTLFCRHPLLDVGFRVLAAIGLFSLGLATQTKILPYLAIPMLIALPVSYQTARVAAAMRRRNLPPVPDDVQTIPADTANTIVTEIKAAFPKQQNTKTLAQLSLNVFELLNARPPHWAATLGILFVHGASLVLAVVFGVVFVLGRDGSLQDGLQTAALMHDEQLSKYDTAVTHTGPAFAADAPRTTIVINLPKSKAAADAFTSLSLTTRVPTNAALTRFGQTLLLSLPAADSLARTKWVREAELLSTNYFVSTTNFGILLSVSGVAPDQAAADKTRQTLNDFFGVPWTLQPIPPWASVDRRAPAERATHDLARASYIKLQTSLGGIYTNAAQRELSQRLGRAQKQGDASAVKDLQAQLRKSQSDLEAEVFTRARTNSAHVPAVISFMEKERALNARFFTLKKHTDEETKTHQQERKALLEELAPHLGTLPEAGKNLAIPADRETTRYGYAGGTQSIVMMHNLALATSPEAAVAVVTWLQKQGYKEIRYKFSLGGLFGGEDD